MSLINDALRRAQRQAQTPPPRPPGMPPLQHVEYQRRPVPWPLLIVASAAVVFLALAAFFIFVFVRYFNPEPTAAPVSAPVATAMDAPAPASLPVAREGNVGPTIPAVVTDVPAPEAVSPPAAAAAAETQRAATPPTASGPVPTHALAVSGTPAAGRSNAVATATDASPPRPVLKLQGIYYSPSRPAALINGRHLNIGETVAGARVIRIERETVTVEREGVTNVLKLP